MRRERNLQWVEYDKLIVLITRNTTYMICASLLPFCTCYFPWCYSDVLFIIYMYHCIYLYLFMCILHIYILYICKYIYYCSLEDKQCWFCKKLYRGTYLLLFKNVLRGNVGGSVRTSYSFFFLSLPCPVLLCSSAEVTT